LIQIKEAETAMIYRALRRIGAVLCAGVLPLVTSAFADESAGSFPSHPLRIVVPFVAGGGTDLTARLLAEKLSARLGQQVVVDNRPGGNTVIATQLVAKAPPDGYTLLLANSTFAINHLITPSLPYDTFKDFAPVSAVSTGPWLMVVHPSVPANNLKEMLALLRASKPGEWNFATVGSSGIGRVVGETFAIDAGVKLQHVPYKGAAQVTASLLAGTVKFTIDPPTPYIQHVKAGRLKALAVSSSKRLASLPDVPTFAEQGMPEFNLQAWNGLLAPAGTPKPIVDKLAAAVHDVLAMPEVRQKLEAMETEPIDSSPEQFRNFLHAESDKFGQVVKTANIKPVE
jgi:tripartite-type tricarboxylate transporter receptor subunit TctC